MLIVVFNLWILKFSNNKLILCKKNVYEDFGQLYP